MVLYSFSLRVPLAVLQCIGVIAFGVSARLVTQCRSSPDAPDWPSQSEWASLNDSMGGQLIATAPVAASCYPDSGFQTTLDCETVTTRWNDTAFHSLFPESVDYPIFAGNPCTPPSVAGGAQSHGHCEIGGYPVYSINVSSAFDISVAVKWAASHNVRLVVKSTGHDFLGRSTGRHSLSLWTANLLDIKIENAFQPRGCNTSRVLPEEVVTFGAGWRALPLLEYLERHSRVVVTPSDPNVAFSGFAASGGHGPLSAWLGLGSDHILEVEIVLANGEAVVSNECKNADLFWAVKGVSICPFAMTATFLKRNDREDHLFGESSLAIQ